LKFPRSIRARVLAGVVASAFLFSAEVAADDVALRSKRGSFEDVRAAVVFAIENRGLVINTVSHVGEMLERTGRDLGSTKRIFLRAEVLEFCSASLSRRAMEADPHTIAFCPYTIAVYVLPEDPGLVHLAYRKPVAPPSSRGAVALDEVEGLLSEIVGEALAQ